MTDTRLLANCSVNVNVNVLELMLESLVFLLFVFTLCLLVFTVCLWGLLGSVNEGHVCISAGAWSELLALAILTGPPHINNLLNSMTTVKKH